MQPHELINDIKSKEDFLKFLTALRNDLSTNDEDWENPTLARYLEAMEAWITDSDAYYINTNQLVPKQPTWKTFADILYAAKIYE
ncbi:DUF7660 family protein [Paenibacillus montanisoli]|uniref:DUF7660 domain-containing protein n=1 Tax=Paenibacillus montanisoli TaxID=2081970 RepID=A0A328TZ38_9BACL|nr:hypothetical protein [Paenibacillus montanisoli]RAP75660.1 hypothetical protein DL346_09375 [Paenibacillus montanisoli]